mgnify:FL=1
MQLDEFVISRQYVHGSLKPFFLILKKSVLYIERLANKNW